MKQALYLIGTLFLVFLFEWIIANVNSAFTGEDPRWSSRWPVKAEWIPGGAGAEG